MAQIIRNPEKYRRALNAAGEARRRLLARLNMRTPRRQEKSARLALRSEQDAWHSATSAARMRYEPKRVSMKHLLRMEGWIE